MIPSVRRQPLDLGHRQGEPPCKTCTGFSLGWWDDGKGEDTILKMSLGDLLLEILASRFSDFSKFCVSVLFFFFYDWLTVAQLLCLLVPSRG